MTTETTSQQPEPTTPKQAGAKKYALMLAGRFGPFIGLFLVIATFAILTNAPSQYLSATNLRIVLSQTVIVAIGAIGMTIIIISGGIDLSVGSVIALTGVVTALGLSAGYSPMFAVAAGVLAGGLIGIINGLAITRLKVVPFIATMGLLC